MNRCESQGSVGLSGQHIGTQPPPLKVPLSILLTFTLITRWEEEKTTRLSCNYAILKSSNFVTIVSGQRCLTMIVLARWQRKQDSKGLHPKHTWIVTLVCVWMSPPYQKHTDHTARHINLNILPQRCRNVVNRRRRSRCVSHKSLSRHLSGFLKINLIKA